MHSALFLEEILQVIFGHCYPQRTFSGRSGTKGADLVALAATCRAFKEPALDVLWAELSDITALVRCLPEVCCSKASGVGDTKTYFFERQLKEIERSAVKRYTFRIRILNGNFIAPYCLDPQSLADLYVPFTVDSFFPNLRRLDFAVMDATLPLIHHFATPMLKSLRVLFCTSNISSCESLFSSLGSNCPNMESMEISAVLQQFSIKFGQIITRQIRCWTQLRTLSCLQISLDINTLAHLSQMPNLTTLSFKTSRALTDQITSSSPLLVFFALECLRLKVDSTFTVFELFATIRLPAVTQVYVSFDIMPPRHLIKSLLMTLPRACDRKSNMSLSIAEITLPAFESEERVILTLDDVCPLTALNLSDIHIDINWIVDLKDKDLVELVSSFRQLSSLRINDSFGWGTPGITPAALAQILEKCPLLSRVCVALDTRGCTHPIQTQSPNTIPIRRSLTVDVIDSVIEADSVLVLASFFADHILSRVDRFSLGDWKMFIIFRFLDPDSQVYKERWEDVIEQAKKIVLERRQVNSSDVITF